MDDHDSLVQLAALVQDRVQGLSGAAPGRPGAAPLPPDVAAERARRVALRAALAMAAAMLDDPGPEGAEAATAGLAALEAALKSWRSSSRSWTEQRVIRRKQPLVEPGPDGAPLVRVVERVYGPYVYVRWRDERGRLRSRCLGLAAQTAGEPEAAAAERDAAAKPGAPAPTGLVARPARRRGPTVGVLVSYTTAGHIYSSGVLAGIHAALRERDGELIVFQEFTPRRILESGLGRRRVDGWIAALDTDGLAELAASGAPLVALGADGGPHCPSVMSDNRGGVCALVHHLIDHGHRRIAFVGSALGAADLRQRFEGYRAALEERGIAYDPALLYEVSAHGRREGREGGRRLIEAGMPCTAVVAGTDWNALGVIDALQAAGYRVPQDIAVVGFDNVDLGQSSAPPLTTVSQSLAALGAAAVRLLLERLGGQPAPAGITYVPSGRVLRRSCGCPGDQRTGAAAALLDRARAIALDELRDTSYSSYRITLPLLERGAAAIMDLDWLTEGNVSQGSLALWPGGAGSPGPSMFDSLPQPAPLGAPAGDAGPAVIVAGSYRRTEDRDEARQLRDACPAADFPSRESLPPTPAAGEVIKIFRIKTFTQPDEWGFLAIRGALDSYHEHIGMWAHMIGSIFERDTLVALLTRAKQAAEQANRLKTQFLSTVSHELRTPLNAIAGFAELLPEDAGAAPPHLRERILANASHLRALIGDLLDTARLDAGRLELHRRTVDLRPLIQGALATAAGLIRERQLELRLELPADLPPVTADPLRIRQVLLNLLANAAKFTPHGSITVSAERRAAAPGGTPQLVVAVRDTGIGIAPEHHAIIFEEFRQVQGDPAREYEGSGLGLAICRRLIELHGGRLWLESAAGAGAAFFFALPAAEPDAAAPAAHPGGERSPAEPARAAILVADDNPDAREILRARLGAAGYRVLEAANGQEALAAMREHRPALALLDLMMPRLDGFAVLRQVREDPAISATPVIVLTAQVLGAAELARFGRRMPTVLEKGVFRTEEVLAHVEAALAGQQTPAGPARRIVRDAMACIHRRYAGRLTREDIAAEAAVGPRHLTRAFQQELGMSPMTYLLRYRINQARLLLAGQDISVAEVARAVGFGSEAHFNRSFRREAGVSPGAYRRGARAERRPAGPNPA